MSEDHKRRDDTGAVDRRTLLAAGGVGLGTAAVLAAGGTVAGAAVSSSGTADASGTAPDCVLTPELEEGPYYLDYELVRKDITEHKKGVPLVLRVTVVDTGTCKPIPRAALDIWHCDALGEYSGYTALGIGGGNGGGMPTGTPTATPTGTPTGAPPGGAGGHTEPTDKLTFLRGVQVADHRGVAEFRTLYPGWYVGRCVHIHAKVHIGGKVAGRTYTDGHVCHTGQFFFDEDVTERVAVLDPYKVNTTTRTTTGEDRVYQNGNGSGVLKLTPLHHGKALEHGMLATLVVGVEPDATPSAT